ncbi:MAG: FtsW/RodA/SpoVE family cell cycle protein [Bacilli bacterium]|nr:FtsW/RodA/SpoVE family cell cycle protein [Bacilli bacterium]
MIKNISKFKVESSILIPIILFFIISIISIYSTKDLLSIEYENLWLKQIIWYLVGIFLAYSTMILGNKFLYNNAWILYIIGVLSLILVLFFGIEVNNATCWFKIPFLGTLQPSEFMKIFLIITLSRMITDFNDKYKNPDIIDELKFILKVLVVLFIPSVLTFIEPDTGAVIMYIIITFVMLFIGGLRKRWFIFTIGFIIIFFCLFLGIYYLKQDLFIDIFGTSFFYRMDRITNWSSSTGLQLRNSLIAIGSSGLTGHGINSTPIYFPEMQTDFIFAVFASNTGLIGSISLLLIMLFFDLTLINSVNKTKDLSDKYAIGGIISVLLFQQIYNISMTIGLLPIMGITLPFISYGGSSLLSYMLLLGIIFNVSNSSLRYTN